MKHLETLPIPQGVPFLESHNLVETPNENLHDPVEQTKVSNPNTIHFSNIDAFIDELVEGKETISPGRYNSGFNMLALLQAEY